jgi:hypothetical protein
LPGLAVLSLVWHRGLHGLDQGPGFRRVAEGSWQAEDRASKRRGTNQLLTLARFQETSTDQLGDDPVQSVAPTRHPRLAWLDLVQFLRPAILADEGFPDLQVDALLLELTPACFAQRRQQPGSREILELGDAFRFGHLSSSI